jgi:hypothetical protein
MTMRDFDPDVDVDDETFPDPDMETEKNDSVTLEDEEPHDEESPPANGPEAADAEGIADAEIAARAPRWVPMSDLHLDYKFWSNPRRITGLDPASLQAMADDIAMKTANDGDRILAGIDDPLTVVRIAKGKGQEIQLVIDGQRRYRAAELAYPGQAGETLVPVRDREPEAVTWSQETSLKYLSEVLKVVGLREGLSAFELSESAERLRDSTDPATGKKRTLDQIAVVLHRSPSWVSKTLTARSKASNKLLVRWEDNELTEEQFYDLAVGVADHQEQLEVADKVTEARKSGDKATARTTAKELRERAKIQAKEARDAAKAAKADKKRQKAEKKKGPVVRGPQASLPLKAKPEPDAPAAPPRPKPMHFAAIQDTLEQAKRRPPTADIVRGILLGMSVAAGISDAADLPKAWHKYVHHLAGTQPAKPAKPSKRR